MDELRAQPDAGRGAAPSDAATRRLGSALSDSVGGYRSRLEFDLQIVDRLSAEGDLEAAAIVLQAHIDALSAFSDEVERLVADAAVEREAESVVDDALDDPAPPAEAVPSSRRLVPVLLAAVAALALVPVFYQVDNPLLAAAGEATGEVAAVTIPTGEETAADFVVLANRTRDLVVRIRALPPEALADEALRERLQGLLRAHGEALAALEPWFPAAEALRSEILSLVADLEGGVPPAGPPATVDPPAVDPPAEPPAATRPPGPEPVAPPAAPVPEPAPDDRGDRPDAPSPPPRQDPGAGPAAPGVLNDLPVPALGVEPGQGIPDGGDPTTVAPVPPVD